MKLLTQAEAAAALRKSEKAVYRLRLSGQLAYIPGRPVTITEAAINDYLARTESCRDRTKDRSSTKGRPGIGKSGGPSEVDRCADQRARKIMASLCRS